jgi:uncharacterized peroxidase-related enzyme
MNRVAQLDPAQATGKTKQLFEAVQARLGLVPNLIQVLGTAPAALEGYLNFCGALAEGNLSVKIREQIALTVAESNLCRYCLSEHSFTGSKVGLTEAEIIDARCANAADDKTDAALKLARSIVVYRGEVSDADLSKARTAGLTDSDIVETIANVVVSIFTNYVNHVARTEVDFPETKPGDVEVPIKTLTDKPINEGE